MAKNPKPYWKLGKVPSFKTDFLKLTPYGQWVIGRTIERMLYLKEPQKTYRYTNCDDCMPDLFLFGVLDDGIGNKGLELQIYLDKKRKVLAPITVRKAKR
ncbi:hypothetical protein AAA799P11_00602 [Marine Group I thaumarchaeote SCGC AAA799-P11]|uniref:Uncharacterized protein n=1 Tax=Marine Group I thaumarchaeote SCGC AAA799-P11 TaxID=1502295 RepID=A0A087S1K9_9ARCH|nr:hypothetical protein AAA799P11_00602 [Marine Group I thaumarchaeote SCGC AAA799-P11]